MIVAVCVPCYERPPHSKFPVAVDSMTEIYSGFVSRYGASNIVLAGDSAGGNLCLTIALNAFKNRGLPAPAGLVLVSPWCDLTEAAEASPSMSENAATDYLPVPLISDFARDYVASVTALSDPLVSPLLADSEDLKAACPKAFLCYGTGEELLDQGRALAAKLLPAAVVELEGMPHVSPLFATPVYGEGPGEPGGELPEPVRGLNAIVDFINNDIWV